MKFFVGLGTCKAGGVDCLKQISAVLKKGE